MPRFECLLAMPITMIYDSHSCSGTFDGIWSLHTVGFEHSRNACESSSVTATFNCVDMVGVSQCHKCRIIPNELESVKLSKWKSRMPCNLTGMPMNFAMSYSTPKLDYCRRDEFVSVNEFHSELEIIERLAGMQTDCGFWAEVWIFTLIHALNDSTAVSIVRWWKCMIE